jgi:hypothetical protein
VKRKIPPEAFAFYLALGIGRTYQAVAERYSASKRAVQMRADKERWQERLAEEESKARVVAEKKAADSIETVNDHHLKVLRFIQGKSIETLKTMQLESAMDAVKAYTLALDKERLIRGGTGDQTIAVVVQTSRDEIRSVMTTVPLNPEDPNDF